MNVILYAHVYNYASLQKMRFLWAKYSHCTILDCLECAKTAAVSDQKWNGGESLLWQAT